MVLTKYKLRVCRTTDLSEPVVPLVARQLMATVSSRLQLHGLVLVVSRRIDLCGIYKSNRMELDTNMIVHLESCVTAVR